MTDADELSGEQQQAAQIMARWAADAGYRGLSWSVPNDASWPREFLAGLPVRRDGLSSSFDLLGRRRRWHPECTVCSLVRGEGRWWVMGVPDEEWFRPSATTMPASGPQHGDLIADLTDDPEPHPRGVPEPLGTRPRLRARLTAAAVGLAIPAAALGGVLVVTTTGNQQPLTPTAAPLPVPAQTVPTPEPPPPLPDGTAEWATTAHVQLAAVTEQLATLADAEAAWMALPPEQRSGPPPAPIADLQANKAELTQRRALLEADLAAWDALHDVRAQLTDTEERLTEVRRALALSETGDTAQQLRAQEARLARQSQSQRSQLADTEEVVDTAATAPPPRQMDVTDTVTEVLTLVTRPLTPADDPQEQSAGSAPLVAAGREIDGDSPAVAAPDDEPDDDGPDDDDGPGPESERDRAGVADGVVGDVVGSLPVLGDNSQDVGTGGAGTTDPGDPGERLEAISGELDGISSELDAIEASLAPVDAQPVNPFTPDPAQDPVEASVNPFAPQDPAPEPVDSTGSGLGALDVPDEPAPTPVAEPTDLDATVADAQAGAHEAAATLDAALADISDEDKQMLHDHVQAAADELAAQLNGQPSSSMAVTMDAPPPGAPTANTLSPPVWNPPGR